MQSSRLRVDDDDDDVASVRAQLRGDGDNESPMSKMKLLKAIRKAHEAVLARHRELMAAWGGTPISLFDKHSERKAERNGVPRWAIARVREVQQLVDQAIVLGGYVESYEIQIEEAFAERRGIGKTAALRLLLSLDLHERRMRAQLLLLDAARDAFNRPAEAPQEEPDAKTLADRRGCDPEIDPQERRVIPLLEFQTFKFAEMCDRLCDSDVPLTDQQLRDAWNDFHESCEVPRELVAPPTATQKLRTAARSAMAATRLAARRAATVATAAAGEARVAELREHLNVARSLSRRQMGNLVGGVNDLVEGVAEGVRSAVGSTPEVQSRRLPWDETRGRPSAWLAVDEPDRERRSLNARMLIFSEESPSALCGAKSRWERTRRLSDRRWSLS